MLPTDEQRAAWADPAAIRQWWSSPAQTNFYRPYTAELVASLRSPFVEFWPSSEQGLRLREIFKQHAEQQTASINIGAPDGITAHLMQAAGYDTLYVSGGVCSIHDNSTQDFGADMADYPSDTVPRKVHQIFRSQLFQAKNAVARQRQGGSTITQAEPPIPIIADADTGHGGQTANMKLAKMFVEAGAAAIHLDDQVPGTKKFGAKTAGRVLVPVEEHIARLQAVKLQFDVMGAECLLIHRTDAETAGYLTSAISPVDRPYILGSTAGGPSLLSHVASVGKGIKSQAEAAEEEWVAAASLCTLDEAVEAQHPDRFDQFVKASQALNLDEALGVARSIGIDVRWSAEAARSREGWYRFRGSIQPAIDRAIACAHHADVLWTRTPATVVPDLEKFATDVRAAVPGALLAYNLAADVQGTDSEIRSFTDRLAKMGYVWQFLPLAGLNGMAVGADVAVRAIRKDGVLGYMQTVTQPSKQTSNAVANYAWLGGAVADASVAAVTAW